MKRLFLGMLLFVSLAASAQSLSDQLRNPGFSLQDSIADKLATMVTKTGYDKYYDKEIEGNLYELRRNKATWLNSFIVSGNLNEANLQNNNSTSADGTNLFFPRYNFGFQLPLGAIFTRGGDVRMARAKYEQSKVNKDIEIGKLKEAIKMQYQEYSANKLLLELQQQVLQDESVLLEQITQKFDNNEVALEVFTNASKRYNTELARKVELLRDVNSAKIKLETLIGMRLEDALKAIGASERSAPARPGRK